MSAKQEELEAVRAYDEAKTSTDEAILLAEAIREIEDEPDNNN